jgi:glucose-1-phosphate cytidylyltransferase
MKVVLFCGGLGLRIRDVDENVPKPMIPIGYRPILWHLMRYYAHYGHKDFILALGHRADVVKRYFLNYEESVSNDFVLSGGGRDIALMNTDISDWRITFADTGATSNIGQRLCAVRKYLEGEDVFLANYADGLSDLPLDQYVDRFVESGNIASFVCVKPNLSYHAVALGRDGRISGITPIRETDLRINGGFFALRQEIFDYIRDGEELVSQPFQRLLAADRLWGYPYDGFFAAMDTFKDKQHLDDLYATGRAPWQVWQKEHGAPAR